MVAEVKAVKGSALSDLSDQLRQSKKADAVLSARSTTGAPIWS